MTETTYSYISAKRTQFLCVGPKAYKIAPSKRGDGLVMSDPHRANQTSPPRFLTKRACAGCGDSLPALFADLRRLDSQSAERNGCLAGEGEPLLLERRIPRMDRP